VFNNIAKLYGRLFLQGVSIACYADRGVARNLLSGGGGGKGGDLGDGSPAGSRGRAPVGSGDEAFLGAHRKN